jgi:hypothetical protein
MKTAKGGLSTDVREARTWYSRAADADDGRGMSGLGFLFQMTAGGSAQAVNWFPHRSNRILAMLQTAHPGTPTLV